MGVPIGSSFTEAATIRGLTTLKVVARTSSVHVGPKVVASPSNGLAINFGNRVSNRADQGTANPVVFGPPITKVGLVGTPLVVKIDRHRRAIALKS